MLLICENYMAMSRSKGHGNPTNRARVSLSRSSSSSSNAKAMEGVLFELSLALQKPPHYPKLGLLSRILLQLNAVYIVVNNKFPWTRTAPRVLEIINFPILAVQDLDFTGYTIIWCLLVAVILGCIGFTKYAEMRLASSHMVAAPWMMRVVRAVFGLFSAVPVGLFAVILGYASCNYGQFNVIPGNNLFFDYECLNGSIDKIIGFCASIIAGVLFVGIGFAQGLIYPSDPQSLSIFRRAHARLESATILSQFALYIGFLLLPHYVKVFGVAYLLLQIALFVGWVVFQPLYVSTIQDMQVGLAALPCWAGICFLALMGGTDLYDRELPDNTTESDRVSKALSILLVAGAVPVMFGGYVLSGVVRKKIPRVARNVLLGVRDDEAAFNSAIRMYDGTAATGTSDSIKSTLVEVAARSLVGPRDANINAACSVLRRGIIRFPQSVYLRLQYCKYLIRAKTMAEQATDMVQSCEMLRLPTDQMLALNLFRKEAAAQLRKQRFGGNGNGGGSEGFDEAELKQRLSDAKVLYIKCTQLVSEAWAELQKDSQRRDKAAAKKQRAVTAVTKFVDGEGEGRKHRKAHHRKASSSKAKRIGLDEDIKGGTLMTELVKNDAAMKKPDGPEMAEEDDGADPVVTGRTVTSTVEMASSIATAVATKEQLAGRSIHSILTALEKLREMESKADAAFEFLMEKCPESPEVLHEYAAYVRAVKFDEKGARNLESRRDMAIVAKESTAKGEGASISNNREALGSHSDRDDDDDNDDKIGDSSSSSSSSDNDVVTSGDDDKNRNRHNYKISARAAPAELVRPSEQSLMVDDSDGSDVEGAERKKKQSKPSSRQRSILRNTDIADPEMQMETRNSLDDIHSRGSSEMSANQFESAEKNIAKERTELATLVRSSASKLMLELRIFTLMLLLLSSAIFWVFFQMEGDAVTATTDTDFSGFRRFDCSQFAYHTRNMQLAAIRGKTATFEEARSFIISSANDFSDIHSTLSQSRKIYSRRLRSFYDDPVVKMREAAGVDASGNAVISEGLVTGSQAADKLILAALNVAYSNASSFINYDPRNPSTFPAFFFVIDNAMPVFQAMDSATILTVLEVDQIVFLCMVIVGVLCAVAALVECYIIVAMFRPAVSNLFEQLGKTVDELSSIDRTERSTMASRFRAVKEQAESQWNQTNNNNNNHNIGENNVSENEGGGSDFAKELVEQMKLHEDAKRSPSSIPPSPNSTPTAPENGGLASALRSFSSTVSNLRNNHDGSGGVVTGAVRFVSVEGSKASSVTQQQRQEQRRRATLVKNVGDKNVEVADEESIEMFREKSTDSRVEINSGLKITTSSAKQRGDWNYVGATVVNITISSEGGEDEEKRIPSSIAAIPTVAGGKLKLPPLVVDDDDVAVNGKEGVKKKPSGLLDDIEQSNPQDQDGDSDGDPSDEWKAHHNNKSSYRGFFGSRRSNAVADINSASKKKANILSHLTKSSLERKESLERWYIVCFVLVIAALVVVFALGYTSTDSMKTVARSMNNVCRRRDIARGMSWLALETLNVYDPQTSLAGGLQRITTSEDSIRCYFQEMITAILQIHGGNLDGVDGWNRAKSRSKVKNDWNTECTVFTDQEDLYQVAAELGNGAVRRDTRMNTFMFANGQCLSDPGDLAGISSLASNSRTAPLLAKFSSSKCLYFNQGEGLVSLGLNTLFDELMLVYQNIAYGSAKVVVGISPVSDFYSFIATWTLDTSEFGIPSEEWGLGLRKGALLMEAKVFDTQTSNLTVIAAAFSVLVAISLLQLLWLGSRIHHVIQDNSQIFILVRRMLKAAAKEKSEIAIAVKQQQQNPQQQNQQQHGTRVTGWM